MFIGLIGQLAHQVATFGRCEPRVGGFANDAKAEQGEVFAWICAHAHLRVPSGNEHHPIRSTPLRKGRASVGTQRLAAADQTQELPHGGHTLTKTTSSSLPGSTERFEGGALALTRQEHRGWIKLHRHSHQGRRQDRGTHLKASSPSARRRHRHPQPIGHALHAEPTDDAECQRLADDLNRVYSTLQQKIGQQPV
jgi:hypothetical protein